MSAECHVCGADITYPPGTWPVGSCERCDLNAEIDRLRDTLTATENALRETWQALTDYADHEDEKYLMDAFSILDAARGFAAARVVVSADPPEEV